MMNIIVLRALVPMAAVALVSGIGCSRPLPSEPVPNLSQAKVIRTSFTSGLSGSGGDSAEPAQQPTGWATLRGSFTLNGTAPSPIPLNVDKEREVCAPGGMQHFSEEIVVSENGGIKNIVIYLTQSIPESEPWTHPSAQPGSRTDEVLFDQKNCIFVTHVLAMQTSQQLRIANSDNTGHNFNGLSINQTVPSNRSMVVQINNEQRQPAPVACGVHPWMKAFILTRDNGYFAVTDEEGNFEVPNLPAGVELELRVWQEKVGFLQQVTVNGVATEWSKGKMLVTLDAENAANNQFDIEVAASVFN